ARLAPPSAAFFSQHAATTRIYPLSLHDALPISGPRGRLRRLPLPRRAGDGRADAGDQRRSVDRLGPPDRLPARDAGGAGGPQHRSEEHTSELQSREKLVCRLLLEKKNQECHVAW